MIFDNFHTRTHIHWVTMTTELHLKNRGFVLNTNEKQVKSIVEPSNTSWQSNSQTQWQNMRRELIFMKKKKRRRPHTAVWWRNEVSDLCLSPIQGSFWKNKHWYLPIWAAESTLILHGSAPSVEPPEDQWRSVQCQTQQTGLQTHNSSSLPKVSQQRELCKNSTTFHSVANKRYRFYIFTHIFIHFVCV